MCSKGYETQPKWRSRCLAPGFLHLKLDLPCPALTGKHKLINDP